MSSQMSLEFARRTEGEEAEELRQILHQDVSD